MPRLESRTRGWSRAAVGAVAIAACSNPAPESTRKLMPILTPAQDKQLRAFAPDCQPPYTEGGGDVMITCAGGIRSRLAMIDRHLDDHPPRDSDGTELEPSGYPVAGFVVRSYASVGDMPGYQVELIWSPPP
jgi:hypothetical protein